MWGDSPLAQCKVISSIIKSKQGTPLINFSAIIFMVIYNILGYHEKLPSESAPIDM